MNGYVCFWNGKRCEVEEETSYAAQQAATAKFRKGTRKKVSSYDVTATLAEKDEMFQVDADVFKVILPNGYTLTFTPCDECGEPHYLQPDFDEDSPKPFPHLKLNVGGNGTNVNHRVENATELWQQIKSYSEEPKPTTS